MDERTKQRIVAVLRATHLLGLAELARFVQMWWRYRADNARFLAETPGFAPPPAFWMYEAYGHTSLRAYVASGAEAAAFMERQIRAHCAAPQPAVAEWGCGLARILRPLQARTGWAAAGFDYNAASIAWCRENIEAISFLKNELNPPLPCADASFDALYCVSVFTHLPEDLQMAWIAELRRVIRPGGVLIATFHGDRFLYKLLPHEAARFRAGELVVRGNSRKGGRLYGAYHPKAFITQRLLAGWDILDVVEDLIPSMGQVVYVARRTP